MQGELLKKLRYKQGRALVLHAPEGYKLGIEDSGEPVGTYDFLFGLHILSKAPRSKRILTAIACLRSFKIFLLIAQLAMWRWTKNGPLCASAIKIK
ncbi:hypothetical protein GCM10008018_20310 [Paenibacillus marchantiophytorum]|uniref:Uncharacterized protein n=1 Tax=Paenibacillus marchantiophytorum TaxID=1619310 RepID=A0ABQ2BVT2_9BACL|nr:hypothetical protein [Paenibacillus marchantiophytorum]GGI47068.1 hypothetical protein GCM10008018_20310 [Paenibacillus marchantiophytorum]